jgi:hypothetical protein
MRILAASNTAARPHRRCRTGAEGWVARDGRSGTAILVVIGGVRRIAGRVAEILAGKNRRPAIWKRSRAFSSSWTSAGQVRNAEDDTNDFRDIEKFMFQNVPRLSPWS